MATFEEQRLFEECSELRARLTTANKENETLRRERDEVRAMFEQKMYPSESCRTERAEGNGGCGGCSLCVAEEKRARLAAEAHNAALREALDEAEHCLTPATKKLMEVGFWPHEPYALGAIRAALALAPDDALRALVTRACEAQREADRSAFLSLLKQARSEVSGLKEYRPSLGVDVCENMTLRREHQAPLAVDDVLGKAGK